MSKLVMAAVAIFALSAGPVLAQGGVPEPLLEHAQDLGQTSDNALLAQHGGNPSYTSTGSHWIFSSWFGDNTKSSVQVAREPSSASKAHVKE